VALDRIVFRNDELAEPVGGHGFALVEKPLGALSQVGERPPWVAQDAAQRSCSEELAKAPAFGGSLPLGSLVKSELRAGETTQAPI
jgi:hypothetical protein